MSVKKTALTGHTCPIVVETELLHGASQTVLVRIFKMWSYAIPAFFTLKKYYKSKGDMEAVDLVTKYTEVILEQSGRGSEVRNWFENY